MANAFQQDAFQGDAFQEGGTSAQAGVATGTGTAYNTAMTGALAEVASGTGAAFGATVNVTGSTQAPAGLASGTGTASAAKASVKASAGQATGTATANGATVAFTTNANAGTAYGFGAAYNPSLYQPREPTTATGNPTYPWNLFRGQVVRVDAERIDSLLKVTLTCSDYNRLFSLMKVGAPLFGMFLVQPDGTEVAIDPNAFNYGIGGDGDGGIFRRHLQVYFPPSQFQPVLDLETHVHQTNPDYSGLPVIDWSVALSDSAAFLSEFASRQSGSTRYWIDADRMAHWTTVGPSAYEADFRVPAPFEIDQDAAIQAGNVIQAKVLTASPDHSTVRRRAFVRGGTPESSLWFTNASAPPDAGEEYIDAPGAVTHDDAEKIAEWWFRWNLKTLLTGRASISANDPTSPTWEGHDGWRVGQSLVVSDATLNRFATLPLVRHESVITGIQGRLVSPGAGIGVELFGPDVDITARTTTIQSFTWTEKGFGDVGTATVVIEIVDPDETLEIPELAGIRIFTDGNAAIEYDLEWGDIPGGALSSQVAKLPMPEVSIEAAKGPAYKVMWYGEKTIIPVGGATNITGQLIRLDDSPVRLPGVFISYELLQWADLAETIVGTGFTLASSGTDIGSAETNAAGQIYDILQRGEGTAIVCDPRGQALPIE